MNNKGSRCKMHLKRCFRCILRAAQLKICCKSDEKWQEERSKQRCRKEAERRWWRVGGAEHYVISVAGRKMHMLGFVTKYKTTSLNYASSKDVIVPKIDNHQHSQFLLHSSSKRTNDGNEFKWGTCSLAGLSFKFTSTRRDSDAFPHTATFYTPSFKGHALISWLCNVTADSMSPGYLTVYKCTKKKC